MNILMTIYGALTVVAGLGYIGGLVACFREKPELGKKLLMGATAVAAVTLVGVLLV